MQVDALQFDFGPTITSVYVRLHRAERGSVERDSTVPRIAVNAA